MDSYLEKKNTSFTEQERTEKTKAFNMMVDFITRTYPNQGFAKKPGTRGISKPYFEGIAIGSYLALKENPNIATIIPDSLIVDKENRNDFYKSIEGRYKTHTSQKIFSRINIVKEAFLHGTK